MHVYKRCIFRVYSVQASAMPIRRAMLDHANPVVVLGGGRRGGT